ncbi:hypothetical protein OCU04_001031 [Sclerotinia nivalis]|uniref:Rhodopsin domain-containing protein n=1 Tax=Sclerotinia nivalis TaxID=352851 RepID=A0A9X0AXT0_9HELO|nr:hypothetical protein OCU04_001031 [Sclerotinia nivalis]
MGDLKPTIIGLTICFGLLSIIAVLLRFNARKITKAPFGADDYLAFSAMLCTLFLCVDVLIAVYDGNLGGHLRIDPTTGEPIQSNSYLVFSKCLWVAQFLSVPAAGFNKLSVLFLYRRIFIGKVFSAITICMIVIVSIWNVSFFLANLLDCIPINLNWRPAVGTSGFCINILTMFWAILISDILTDAIILTLPWYQIWKLKMSTARKLQISAIFLLGGLVVGAGIVRCILSVGGVASQNSDFDYTYSRSPAVYWTIIHSGAGVISSCLPTFRPLITHYRIDKSAYALRSYWTKSTMFSGRKSMPTSDSHSGQTGSQSELVEMKGVGAGQGGMHQENYRDYNAV